MKFFFIILFMISPRFALADEAKDYDLDKPVTTTLRKVNQIIAAAQQQGNAQCVLQGASPLFQEITNQAKIKDKKQ